MTPEELPTWLDPAARAGDHQGLRPLGLEAVGFWMVDTLLPNLTGTTRHVRYYSFLSWAFWTLNRKTRREGRTVDVEIQEQWRNRMENAMRAATLSENEDVTGLVGVTKTPRLMEDAPFQIEADVSTTAFDPAFYKPSWRDLRCGELSREGPGTIVKLTETGVALAEAYDQAVRRCDNGDAYQRLIGDESAVAGYVIEDLAPGLRLDRVPPETNERELLLDLLVRQEAPATRLDWKSIDEARAGSVGLLLAIIDEASGSVRSEEDFLRVFGTGILPSQERFSPPDAFHSTWSKWRRYEERQYQKSALYGFWVALNVLLDYQELTVSKITERMTEAARRSTSLIELLGDTPLEMSVGDAQQRLRVAQIRDDAGNPIGTVLHEQIRSSEKLPGWIGSSLALLLWISDVWAGRREEVDSSIRQLHSYKGCERLSLECVTVDALQRKEWSVHDYLGYVLERYVLGQATHIALEKLERGDMRFFVTKGDDGYRRVKQKPRAPTGLLEPDEPRIGNVLEMLTTLGVLDRSNDECRLTTRGSALLEELRVGLGGEATEAARA